MRFSERSCLQLLPNPFQSSREACDGIEPHGSRLEDCGTASVETNAPSLACRNWSTNFLRAALGNKLSEFFREANCADCRFPHGVPFAYYREDTFYGGAGIAWVGLVGDILIGLIGAAVAVWLIDWA
jgi:hypothetical protein